MPFNLDNQTLLYVIIGLFVVQLIIMKYYTQYNIEESLHRNNKKLVKKLATQVNDTFEQYMGRNRGLNEEAKQRDAQDYEPQQPQRGTRRKEDDVNHNRLTRETRDEDSIDDPADDDKE
jgi:type III secretory pathway component EscR